MGRQTRLIRQWILLRTLSARRRGAAVKELAEEMAVGEKTIRRDLETFQSVGFPLIEDVERHGRKRWRLDPARSRPELSFAFDEAVALYLGRRLMEPLAGTVFWQASRSAFRKIRASLTAQALRYIDSFAPLFHQTAVGTSDYSEKGEMIDRLVQATEERRHTFIRYRSLRATESVSYPVYPYGLVHHHGSLYLVGYAPDHDEIRHWKVDRIEDAVLEKLPFTRPEDFDLREHLSASFGVFHGEGEVHVKVRFSPTVARYVQEKSWHASQKLTPEKDGGVIAEFDLDGTEEVKTWILSFGRHAEVLEPEELREQMTEEFEACTQMYRKTRAKT